MNCVSAYFRKVLGIVDTECLGFNSDSKIPLLNSETQIQVFWDVKFFPWARSADVLKEVFGKIWELLAQRQSVTSQKI
jgi:hypothetical protein